MIVKPLPKWAMQRYSKLWVSFKSKEFTYDEASKILKEKDENLVRVVLSYLRKYGWLEVSFDPKDNRKRIYKLRTPEEVVIDIYETNKT